MHQFPHVGLAEVVFLAPCLDARKIEDVIDKCGQAFAFLTDNAVVLLIFLRMSEAPHFESFCVEPDQGERRSQFVGNIGYEIRLESCQRHLLGDIAVGQYNPARQHQGECRQSEQTCMRETLANRCQSGSTQLDGQHKIRKHGLQIALDLRFPAVPSRRGN